MSYAWGEPDSRQTPRLLKLWTVLKDARDCVFKLSDDEEDETLAKFPFGHLTPVKTWDSVGMSAELGGPPCAGFVPYQVSKAIIRALLGEENVFGLTEPLWAALQAEITDLGGLGYVGNHAQVFVLRGKHMTETANKIQVTTGQSPDSGEWVDSNMGGLGRGTLLKVVNDYSLIPPGFGVHAILGFEKCRTRSPFYKPRWVRLREQIQSQAQVEAERERRWRAKSGLERKREIAAMKATSRRKRKEWDRRKVLTAKAVDKEKKAKAGYEKAKATLEYYLAITDEDSQEEDPSGEDSQQGRQQAEESEGGSGEESEVVRSRPTRKRRRSFTATTSTSTSTSSPPHTARRPVRKRAKPTRASNV